MTLQDFLAKAHELFLGPTVVTLTKERDELKAERDTLKAQCEEFQRNLGESSERSAKGALEMENLKAQLETTKAALAEAEKKAVKIIASASITEDTAGKATSEANKPKPELRGRERTEAAWADPSKPKSPGV